MKTYISGRISDIPFEEVQIRFDEAESLLKSIGMDPVNPLKNGLSIEHVWEMHIVKDIELLLTCEAILMLDEWINSKGSRIEHFVAKETGKVILYESQIYKEAKIQKIISINK